MLEMIWTHFERWFHQRINRLRFKNRGCSSCLHLHLGSGRNYATSNEAFLYEEVSSFHLRMCSFIFRSSAEFTLPAADGALIHLKGPLSSWGVNCFSPTSPTVWKQILVLQLACRLSERKRKEIWVLEFVWEADWCWTVVVSSVWALCRLQSCFVQLLLLRRRQLGTKQAERCTRRGPEAKLTSRWNGSAVCLCVIAVCYKPGPEVCMSGSHLQRPRCALLELTDPWVQQKVHS